MKIHQLPHGHDQKAMRAALHLPGIESCSKVAEMFKQVSHPSRLRIFLFLCHCEECVSDIAAAVEMSDPAVSHHLKLMKSAGLIESRREGKEVYYKAADSKQTALLHHAVEEMMEIACVRD